MEVVPSSKKSRLRGKAAAVSYAVRGAVIICIVHVWFSRRWSALSAETFFPESASSKNAAHSTSTISNSSSYIDASVVLSGVAKDIQPHMARTMVRKLRHLGKFFRKYHIIIYENNSHEASIRAWNDTFLETAQDDDFTFRSENVLSPPASRPQRIARARNIVLEILHERFLDYDYVIVTDLDGCCDGPESPSTYNPAVFRHAIHERGDEWDALSFRGHEFYWDRWAFREETVMRYNMYGPKAGQNAIKTPAQMQEWVLSLNKNQLQPVLSAFMMISIYRINATLNCQYSGVGKHGEADCEHVAFHREMKEKNHARIRLWPVLICHNITESIAEAEARIWN